MQIENHSAKEEENKRKHGFGFSLADQVFANPLTVVVYDRFESGEHRWHAIGHVADLLLVVVYTYPDPDDENLVRVIGLRKASAHERKRYEERDFDG